MVDFPAPDRPTRPIFSPARMVRLSLSITFLLAASFVPYAKLTLSKQISPRETTSGLASAVSTTVCGLESIVMPSRTVPMCSNKAANSHMIQCEIPFSRNAIAVAAATAPTPIFPFIHSHSVTPDVEAISSTLNTWFTTSNVVIMRHCRYTVSMKSCIAERT